MEQIYNTRELSLRSRRGERKKWTKHAIETLRGSAVSEVHVSLFRIVVRRSLWTWSRCGGARVGTAGTLLMWIRVYRDFDWQRDPVPRQSTPGRILPRGQHSISLEVPHSKKLFLIRLYQKMFPICFGKSVE